MPPSPLLVRIYGGLQTTYFFVSHCQWIMRWLGLSCEERQAVLNFFPAARCHLLLDGFVDVGWKAFRTAVDMWMRVPTKVHAYDLLVTTSIVTYAGNL